MKLIVLSLLFIFSFAEAYVASKTSIGHDVKWNVRGKEINLYIDINREGINSPSLSDTEIQEIVSDSINQWNDNSTFKIIPNFVNTKPAIGTTQTLSFTTNAAFFGSGTLGITSLGYDSSTGEILTADILLNESFFNSVYFTDTPAISSGNNAFLGDVVTHELGHFIGLGHSEVPGSTMTYSIFKDMYTVESDDIMGLRSIYGPNTGGSISGRITGKNSVGVFGTNVTLISQSTGKIVANKISEADGSFLFQGLTKDHYVIYTAPLKSKDNLPIYYSTAVNNYCQGKSYAPSFYMKCGGRNKGRPQLISVDANEYIDVGSVTIRCDSSHDPNYLLLKNKSFSEDYSLRKIGDPYFAGETFYGIFFKEDVDQGISGLEDKFIIDLKDVDNSLGNLYLDLKFITESLGSAVELEVSIQRSDEVIPTVYNVEENIISDRKNLDLTIQHSLSVNSSVNTFEVIITASKISSTEKTEIFGTTSDLINNQYYYGILQGVSEKSGSTYELVLTKDGTNVEDNSACSEGNVVQSSQEFISAPRTTKKIEGGVETNLLSCGTVDFDNHDDPPWGGMMSFCLGLIAILLPLIKKYIPSILLS